MDLIIKSLGLNNLEYFYCYYYDPGSNMQGILKLLDFFN